ncbi:hypothetical protein Scep_030843 [Stephania cephalantha]|uniref:Uncharacterized protein n=1 Tax=Stephania cephalantha TaxID=152367 RepID=A0AAP0HGV7_9MAGN
MPQRGPVLLERGHQLRVHNIHPRREPLRRFPPIRRHLQTRPTIHQNRLGSILEMLRYEPFEVARRTRQQEEHSLATQHEHVLAIAHRLLLLVMPSEQRRRDEWLIVVWLLIEH